MMVFGITSVVSLLRYNKDIDMVRLSLCFKQTLKRFIENMHRRRTSEEKRLVF